MSDVQARVVEVLAGRELSIEVHAQDGRAISRRLGSLTSGEAKAVAAVLAEAGLLVDPAGSLLIQSYAARAEDADAEQDRFKALFNDAIREARRAYTKRDAARAELAEVKSALWAATDRMVCPWDKRILERVLEGEDRG